MPTGDVSALPATAKVVTPLFCAYCGLDHDQTTPFSDEHIIPYAMGGSDKFTIPVCELSNDRLRRAYLDEGVTDSKLAAIRHNSYSGRPLGSAEFTRALEKEPNAAWCPKKRGPKKKADKSDNQETFSFGA